MPLRPRQFSGGLNLYDNDNANGGIKQEPPPAPRINCASDS